MRIGFDLDGVLCDIDVVQLQLIIKGHFTPDVKEYLEELYYENRKPLLNPYLYLAKDDEFIIVTGRAKHLTKITAKWMRRHLPNAKWFVTGIGYTDPTIVAKNKLEILVRENVEIYFDDDSRVLAELRKLSNTIKFIQFGGGL